MKWIGITGGIGSGKTTVSQMIRDKGLPLIDADQVARDVVAPGSIGLERVTREFGNQILNADQSLDRSALAKLVFNKSTQREKLESILHPLIQDKVAEFKNFQESQKIPFAFYDIPLLFEKNLQSRFDLIIVVNAPLELIQQRLKNRNGWSDLEINQRIQSQVPLETKVKHADFVIQNDGNMNHLKSQVDDVLRKISEA